MKSITESITLIHRFFSDENFSSVLPYLFSPFCFDIKISSDKLCNNSDRKLCNNTKTFTARLYFQSKPIILIRISRQQKHGLVLDWFFSAFQNASKLIELDQDVFVASSKQLKEYDDLLKSCLENGKGLGRRFLFAVLKCLIQEKYIAVDDELFVKAAGTIQGSELNDLSRLSQYYNRIGFEYLDSTYLERYQQFIKIRGPLSSFKKQKHEQRELAKRFRVLRLSIPMKTHVKKIIESNLITGIDPTQIELVHIQEI